MGPNLTIMRAKMSLDVQRVSIMHIRRESLPSMNDNKDVLEDANGARTSHVPDVDVEAAGGDE